MEGNICKHEGDKSRMKFYFVEVIYGLDGSYLLTPSLFILVFII